MGGGGGGRGGGRYSRYVLPNRAWFSTYLSLRESVLNRVLLDHCFQRLEVRDQRRLKNLFFKNSLY